MKGGQPPIHIQRWAPADFQNDEHVRLLYSRRDWRTLTFYRTFIDFAFIKGGDLPSDAESLASLLGMPKFHVERALAFCLNRMIFEDNGRLYQGRVRREVARELEFRESQAESGRKGGSLAGKGRPLTQHRGSPNPPSPTPIPLSPTASVAFAPGSQPALVSVNASVVKAPDSPLAKPVAASKQTWLTPFGDDWREAYGGDPSWGEMARVLKRPVDELGPEEVRMRWRLYLGQVEGRFASPTRFAQTVGIWTNEAVARMQPRDIRSMTVGDFNDATLQRMVKRFGEKLDGQLTEIDGGLRNERLAAEWEAARREYDHKAEGGGVKIPGRSPGQIPPQIAGRIGPPTKNQEPRTKNEQTEGVSLPPVSPERQADLDEIKACEATCREYMTLTGKALDEVLWEFSEVKGHRLVRLDTAPAKWLRVTHDRVRSALIEARQEKRKPAGEDPLVKIRRIEASRAARLKGETA